MSDFAFSAFMPSSVRGVLSEFMDTLDSSKVSSFESSSDTNWLLTQFFYDGFVHRSSFDILSNLPSYVHINLVSNHGKLRFDFVQRFLSVGLLIRLMFSDVCSVRSAFLLRLGLILVCVNWLRYETL